MWLLSFGGTVKGIRGLIVAAWAIVTGLASLLGFAFAWFIAPPADREGFLEWLASPVAWVFGAPLWLVVVLTSGLAALAGVLIWRSTRQSAPEASGGRLVVRYDYQHADSSIGVCVMSDGPQPVEWFTIDIRSESGTFDIGHTSSVAGLKASGLGGSMTTISGERLLPGQYGCVMLSPAVGSAIKLKEPLIKSDAEVVFAGEIHMTVGPAQRTSTDSGA